MNVKELKKFYVNASLEFVSKIASLWKVDPLDNDKMTFDTKLSKEYAVMFADEIVTELPVHEVIKAELEAAVKSYVIRYNAESPEGSYIFDARIKEHMERESKNYVSKATLTFEIKVDGIWTTVSRKVYGFTHAKQVRDIKTWATTLYREMLMDFITSSITITVAKIDMEKGLY